MARATKSPAPLARQTVVRCAVYTRKSTEDGLEQAFNSLDAQYEACAAYIASQRHEGWVLAPGRYDDGGISGGTLQRPALHCLLEDLRAGKVQVIVVYKVDRLTRSLADFARIVEILDGQGASFVSITQAFNTTSSMGRLTLNVLLSFAQFEREVTGERIRDKIAASKKKGLWMGGPVPLGYDVQARKLVVNAAEAALVRFIYQRYLALGSVRALAAELGRLGHVTKVQTRASGPHRGGVPFQRGTLYHLLANRIYRGEIVHKGESFPGEHAAIIEPPLWEAVQAALAARGPGGDSDSDGSAPRAGQPSPLIGLLYDGAGRPMTASHARKGSRRYRYYRTRAASAEVPAWSVSAHDIETLVADRLRQALADPAFLLARAGPVDTDRLPGQLARLLATDTPAQAGSTGADADLPPVLLGAPIRKVRRGQCRKRLTRLFHLGFLSPVIIDAIARGAQPPALTARALMHLDLPLRWDEQKTALGFE